MIYWGRWLIRLTLIVLIGLLERVMGLPVVMIMLTSLYASRLDGGWRWGLISIVGIMGAALFMVPFSVFWLMISLSYIWFGHARRLLPSKVIRLAVGSFISSIIIVSLGFGQIHFQQFIYGIVAVFIVSIWLKRHQFHLR